MVECFATVTNVLHSFICKVRSIHPENNMRGRNKSMKNLMDESHFSRPVSNPAPHDSMSEVLLLRGDVWHMFCSFQLDKRESRIRRDVDASHYHLLKNSIIIFKRMTETNLYKYCS